MLPGGLAVVGAYLFCAEAVLRAGDHAAQAGALARACVAGGLEADGGAAAAGGGGSPAPPAVLLHVDAEGRGKLACRKCAPAGGRPEPCELQLGPVAAGLVELRARYALAPLPAAVPAAAAGPGAGGAGGGCAARAAAAGAVLARERAALAGALLEAGGAVLDPGASLAEALARAGSSAGAGGPHEVAVLRGPGASAAPQARGGAALAARCRPAGGSLRGVAFAWGREPAARAARELAQDLVRSLCAREELLLAEADAEAEAEAEAGGAPPGAAAAPPPRGAPAEALGFGLARRCALRGAWLAGGAAASDYLAAGEGLADAEGRCAELWGAPPDGEAPSEEWEGAPAGLGEGAARAWDPGAARGPGPAAAAAGGPGGGGSPSCAALAAAGASAGLAALLAALHWGGQAAPGLAAEL